MQFTSYKSHSDADLLETTKIWEAARATSAAPSFFDPIKIGGFGEAFGDEGTGANNPVRILWNQAQYRLNQGAPVEKISSAWSQSAQASLHLSHLVIS